jgi:tetratricopeptide (TPR) repeat protein
MYETIRAFVSEQTSAAEQEEIRSLHLSYFVSVASETRDVAVTERLRSLEPDLNNLISAHHFALATTPPRPNDALRIAVGLDGALRRRAADSTLVELIDAVLAASPRDALDESLTASALVARVEASNRHQPKWTVLQDLECAHEAARRADNGEATGRALFLFGIFEAYQDRYDAALRRFDQALLAARRVGDRSTEAWTLLYGGFLETKRHRIDEARPRLDLAFRRAQEIGDESLEALVCAYLGYLQLVCGDVESALLQFDRGRLLAIRAGDDTRLGICVGYMGMALQELGRWDEAHACFQGALVVHRRSLCQYQVVNIIAHLAMLYHERGDLASARSHYEQALMILRDLGPHRAALWVQSGLAMLDAATGHLARAERHIDEVERELRNLEREKSYLVVVTLHRGHLELARARACEAAGDPANAAALRDRAADCLRASTDLPSVGDEVRFARRLLERALSSFPDGQSAARGPDPYPPDVLVVESQAQWFRPPRHGRVELRRQRRLQRLLLTLTTARLASTTDHVLSVDDLFRSAWPGQRALRTAMTNRVKVAVATLRKLGLDHILVTRNGGYALSESVEVAFTTDGN